MIKLFKGDDLPVFQFTVKDEDGTVVDLTSATAVKCHIREESASANKFSGTDEDATIQTPKTDGRIDYTLPTGGIDATGIYTAQLEITFGASGEQSTERFQFQVEESLA